MLAPAWLLGEWSVAVQNIWTPAGHRVSACGVFLLAVAYFTSVTSEPAGPQRRAMQWLGGIALIPAAAVLALESEFRSYYYYAQPLSTGLRVIGWTAAVGLPSIVAMVRGTAAWPNLLAALGPRDQSDRRRHLRLARGLGAVALAAQGQGAPRRTDQHRSGLPQRSRRSTSHVMDAGRSASLMGPVRCPPEVGIEQTAGLVVGARGGLVS